MPNTVERVDDSTRKLTARIKCLHLGTCLEGRDEQSIPSLSVATNTANQARVISRQGEDNDWAQEK